MNDDIAHSPLGPSSASRWLNCPGSVLATADLPDTESEFSREGTQAHEIAELCRIEDVSAATYLGPRGKTLANPELVNPEMVEGVQRFLDYVNAQQGDALNESRVHYGNWVPNGFGTLDAAALRPGEADVTDLKYGKGVQVFAADNAQLKLYALGIYADWDWLYQFKQFHLHVFQPRLDHIDSWSISVEDLLAWANTEVRPGALRALVPGAAFNPGSWCQFCKIRGTCRVRAESVFKQVIGEFDSLEEAALKPPRVGLSNAEVAVVLTALPAIKSWCKDIEKHAASEVMQGRAVGDFKFVEGRGKRDWALTEDELVVVWQRAGIPTKDMYGDPPLLSVPKAEKVIGKKHALWVVEGLVAKSAGKPVLVPGSDPRKPVVLDAKVEFGEEDEEDGEDGEDE